MKMKKIIVGLVSSILLVALVVGCPEGARETKLVVVQLSEKGFDFSEGRVVHEWESDFVYFGATKNGERKGYVSSTPGMKDMGDVSLDVVTKIPADIEERDIWPAVMGHVYVIKTRDETYGKIRITAIDPDLEWITFDWAYPID